VDAEDVGAGHSVTAICEITPVGSEFLSLVGLAETASTMGEGVLEGHKSVVNSFYRWYKI
jgi:hypothetical protein